MTALHSCIHLLNTRPWFARKVGQVKPSVVMASYSQGSAPAPMHPEGLRPVPLKQVVDDAVLRWFQDTLAEAERGDIKQQALLGQMYAEGYGCEKDARLAKHWSERARQRGYRMKGVYCEL